MKKIGLAVVTYVNNYGSFLQSFATQQVIRGLGYDTEVINIDGVNATIKKARKKYFLKRCFNINELKSYAVTIHGIVKGKLDKKYAKDIRTRNNVFNNFRKEYFNFSPVTKTWEEMSLLCEQYAAVVVGSDQLWRPVNIEGDFYTLNFVPDEINKVAYSTSFGVSSLPKKTAEKAKKFLNRINSLSVREVSGQKLVKELIGKDIPVVCDPTMLLSAEDWDKYVDKKPLIDSPYILCYFLGSNEEYLKFAKRMKQEKGLKIVGLVHCAGYNKHVDVYMDEMPFCAGPLEFINLIKHAEYVLTDSFHCCAFSILFKKDFFAFRRFADNDEMSTNDRLVTLFDWTGIKGRLLNGTEDITNSLFTPIDYEYVMSRIQEKREDSMKYLANALGDSND